MTARNDITGDSIATKTSTDAYRDGWDRIFKKRDELIRDQIQKAREEVEDKPKSDPYAKAE